MRALILPMLPLMLAACLEPNLTKTNEPPVVVIQRPGDGSVFGEGQPIALQGKVVDDGPLAQLTLSWLDNGDTVLAEGLEPDGEGLVAFTTAELAIGPHAITLKASDAANLTHEATITIEVSEVAENPIITIQSPMSGDRGEVDAEWDFAALVSDPQDEPDALSVEVESDLDGLLCGAIPELDGSVTCAATPRSSGNHRITFLALDTDGNESRKTVVFPVEAVPEEPSITVVAPTAGTAVLQDSLQTMTAQVADRQDAPSNLAVTVVSDLEGTLCPMSVDATGLATCVTSLSVLGDHYVTFTVRDSEANEANATVLVRVTDSSGIDDDGDGQAEINGDCDDTDPSVYQGAPELPDGQDNDCDGVIDEGTVLYDDDNDGYCESLSQPCTDGSAPGDCDDARFTVNPAATEACNGYDDDCDGDTDEIGATGCLPYFADADGDTFGDPATTACVCGPGYPYTATNGLDCNDSQANINPGAPELPDGQDNNCNGSIDEGTSLVDDDGDGYCDSTTQLCSDGSLNGDCNDGNVTVNPGATEVCGNGIDENCNGSADENGAQGCGTWYRDNDLDGYGDDTTSVCACGSPGAGWVQTGGDCNDASFTINPGSAEFGDGVDNNCNGVRDEGTPLYDNDGDGFCAAAACTTQPNGTAATGGDCNDGNAAINPGARETCANGIDDNCNNQQNEGQDAINCSFFYPDNDTDGYGGANGRCYCSAQGIYTKSNNDDCYDANPDARPGQTQWFSSSRGDGSFDYNCDGRSTQRLDDRYDCGCPASTLDPEPFVAGWDGSVAACGTTRAFVSACNYNLNLNIPNPFWPVFGPRFINECLSSGASTTVSRTQTCN